MKKKGVWTLVFALIAFVMAGLAIFLTTTGNIQKPFYSVCGFTQEDIQSVTFYKEDNTSQTTQDTAIIQSVFIDLCMLDTDLKSSISLSAEYLFCPVEITLQSGEVISLTAEYNYLSKTIMFFNKYYTFLSAENFYTVAEKFIAILEYTEGAA